MATFKIIIDKRHKPVNDKYQLTVRVSNKQDVLYLRLGTLMSLKDYDKYFVKKSFDKEVDKVRGKFEKYVDRAKKILPSIEPFDSTKFREQFYDSSFDPDNIVTKEQIEAGLIKSMFNNYVDIKIANSQIVESTKDLYKYTMRTLLKFKPNLTYKDITPEFLSSFENWFLSQKKSTGKNNSLATVGGICRSLRSVLNYYRKRKLIPPTYEYPFLDYKVPNFTPPKLVISNIEIQKIIDCKEFDDLYEEYARDIWVTLYRMNGINFIDLLKMRWDNIVGEHIVITRHKTRRTRRNNIRPISIRISEKIQSMIDKIGDNESVFIFGLINDENYDDMYLKNRNHKLKGKINKYLKRVGKRLNLSMSLDISLARDAYANTHKRAGTNPLKISESMNHSDPRTTTLHYLDNFDQDTLDDANVVIL